MENSTLKRMVSTLCEKLKAIMEIMNT
jgi:hypothetical protein